MKITDIKIRRLRLVENVGELEPAWSPGEKVMFQRGGGSFVEVLTDEGITGIGPEIDDRFMPALKQLLIGQDPFKVEELNATLHYHLPGGTHYQYAGGVDIALWDIIGKACGQPLYKLWGGSKDKVVPYAAMVILSTPEERADTALKLKSEGWQAIKLRLHHDTMKEDIRTVEKVREAVGDDMEIMVDANQAQSMDGWQKGPLWDYRRAVETARELQRLNCYWLEEARPRYAIAEQSRLSAEVDIPIAGGENNRGLHDFVQMCEKNTFSILQPECLVLNGITAMRKVGVLAELYGKKIVPHNGGAKLGVMAHLHLVASWKHAPFLEVIHDPPVGDYRHFFSMMENPPTVDGNGEIEMPDKPGLGVDINSDLIIAD
jgi:L-alanine-DL-glutamate epimerase-like enolase superfamily enzyme